MVRPRIVETFLDSLESEHDRKPAQWDRTNTKGEIPHDDLA